MTRIEQICNSYESGYGHGIKSDGLDLSRTPHSDPELGEAYQYGYTEGCQAWQRANMQGLGVLHVALEKQVKVCTPPSEG